MVIPDYQTIMLPLLKFLADGKEHHRNEPIKQISEEFSLNEEEKSRLLPKGQMKVIDNRIGWAGTYLKKAGLVESPRRGYIKITEKGLDVLSQNPSKIDTNFLNQFPEFVEFRTIRRERNDNELTDEMTEFGNATPEELMENGYNSIRTNLEQELLENLMNKSPAFFENVVSKLLSAMGYGEPKVTGKTGDGGIDGFISQDKLGLDKIFFQAKRFGEDTPVSASMLRDFVGTLEMKGVSKGVFITTSRFPKDAEDMISRGRKNIILIDAKNLKKYMFNYGIGVTTEKAYEIKKIDYDFFTED